MLLGPGTTASLALFKRLGINQAVTHPHDGVTRETHAKLESYFSELLKANQQFNLTAVRDPKEAWARHIEESMALLPLLEGAERIIDVGSGGGLPGMVIAICRPQVSVTLLEATTKKARFLEATVERLSLRNVSVVAQRAEEAAALGSPLRERFDWVTARAVAPLRTLLELTLPFLQVGGKLLAVKGEKAPQEIAEAAPALKALHGKLAGTLSHPSGNLVLIEKLKPTPNKYPRRPGEPKRNPL